MDDSESLMRFAESGVQVLLRGHLDDGVVLDGRLSHSGLAEKKRKNEKRREIKMTGFSPTA